MSIYTSLVTGLLFPLHERLKGHSTVSALKAMELSQWLPPAEIAELQLHNLRAFLSRIGRDVPYYRELYHALDLTRRG